MKLLYTRITSPTIYSYYIQAQSICHYRFEAGRAKIGSPFHIWNNEKHVAVCVRSLMFLGFFDDH